METGRGRGIRLGEGWGMMRVGSRGCMVWGKRVMKGRVWGIRFRRVKWRKKVWGGEEVGCMGM